ncbi:MAG TPA: SRPBCC domain-containing protein [Streptosporangiaceae bacterium]
MKERSVTHATVVLERVYDAPPARVFAAWADPAIKTRWFTGAVDPEAPAMRLDFRVGGTEQSVSGGDGRPVIKYEGQYRDIVPGSRIVVANWIDVDGTSISVSQFTAEFHAEGGGTRLVVTEQGAYLDGHDTPDSRSLGITAQLDALATELAGTGPGRPPAHQRTGA